MGNGFSLAFYANITNTSNLFVAYIFLVNNSECGGRNYLSKKILNVVVEIAIQIPFIL
jgi:hypothetical protein